MKFVQTLKYLKQGFKARRKSWDELFWIALGNTKDERVTHWRLKNGNLESKYVVNGEIKYDWHIIDLFLFPVDGRFVIEERFERLIND